MSNVTLYKKFLGTGENKKCLETGENEKCIGTGKIQLFPSEPSAEGAKRGERCLQLPDWSPPDNPL